MKHTVLQQVLITVFLLPSPFLLGQNVIGNLGHVPSPQAVDLGRFGDISTSLYTGRADITVPIYSFNQRGVPLDIALSYDTSGLPDNRLPGWVGPGWTLQAGGVITRSQQNFCDEMVFSNGTGLENFNNYFHAFNTFVNSAGMPQQSTITNGETVYWNDYMPDVYYFNFMGHTGHFFLATDGEWKVSSEDNLVVEFDYSNSNNYITPPFPFYPNSAYTQPKAIKGFTIYDDQGTAFIFGGDTTSIEFSINLYRTTNEENQEPWVATAWYLKQVKDRHGQILYSFNYKPGKYLVQLFYTPYIGGAATAYSGTLILPVYPDKIFIGMEDIVTFNMEQPYSAGTAAQNLYPSMYVNNVAQTLLPGGNNNNQYPFYYLQKNTSDVLRYNALPSPNYNDPLASMDIRFIKEIRICRQDTIPSVRYRLGYDEQGRRHLSSLSAFTTDGRVSRYSFKYYDYGSVPRDYLTNQHDYWGFYNRPYYHHGTLIQPSDPYYHEDEPGGNGNSGTPEPIPMDSLRKADREYSMKGMLKEMVYPTGGKTVLDYELNDYSRIQNTDQNSMSAQTGTAGGLRIKSITNYVDSLGQSMSSQRQFSYTNPDTGVSTGQLVQNDGQQKCYVIYTGSTHEANSAPVIPLATHLGTHIGYSYVTETVTGIGSHRYHYSNFDNSLDNVTHMLQPAQNEFDPYESGLHNTYSFMRGKLLGDTILSINGTTVQEKKYSYRTDDNVYMSQFSYAFNNSLYINSPELPSIKFWKSVYRLYYAKYDVARVISNTRYGTNMVSDTTYLSMTTFDQKPADWQVKPYFRKCVQEKTSRGGSNITKSYTYTPQTRYFVPLTSIATSENGTVVQTDQTIYGQFNNYPQPLCETTQFGSGPVDTLVTYHTYTTTGRPQTFTRKGEHMTKLYWDTSKDRLRASVTCPSSVTLPNSINATSQHPLNVLQVNNQSIFTFPEVKAETYVYDNNGNLSASATGNGLVRYFSYDALGRLTEIRDAQNRLLQRFTYHYSTASGQ